MAYPNFYIRVNILGDAFGGAEIWNTGFNIILSPTYEPTVQQLETIAEQVALAWDPVFRTPFPQRFPSSHRTVSTKASLIGTDGLLYDDRVGEFFYPEPLVGGSNEIKPAQIATVVTLRSDVRKGPAALGRMYLPPLGAGISEADGLYQGYTDELAEDMVEFFRAVNLWAPGEGGVGLTSPVGEGRQSLVTRLGVDSRPDTQRRRANSLQAELSFIDVYEEEEGA